MKHLVDDGVHHLVRWLSGVDGDGACLLITGPEWGSVLLPLWLRLAEFFEPHRYGVLIRLSWLFHASGARMWR